MKNNIALFLAAIAISALLAISIALGSTYQKSEKINDENEQLLTEEGSELIDTSNSLEDVEVPSKH